MLAVKSRCPFGPAPPLGGWLARSQAQSTRVCGRACRSAWRACRLACGLSFSLAGLSFGLAVSRSATHSAGSPAPALTRRLPLDSLRAA